MNRDTKMRQPYSQGGKSSEHGVHGATHGSDRGGHLRRYGGIGMLQRHGEEFKVTKAQHAKINELREKHEIDKAELEAAQKKAKVNLRHLMRTIPGNGKQAAAAHRKKVYAAIEAVGEAENALRRMRYDHMEAARNLMNASQRKKLETWYLDKKQEKVKAAGVT
ncbi:MAG: hypothetical protein R3325_16445 [Thermoanaerobaculia bacterium]|nr:hypothetical protein [Thermoanaerobaculia bacterium]